jgi:hypothetical protein
MLGGDPVVAVVPVRAGRLESGEDRWGDLPHVVVLRGDEWVTLVPVEDPTESSELSWVARRQGYDAWILGDSRRHLWLAHQFRYRVDRYSPAGKLRLRIEVDGGEVKHRDDPKTLARQTAALEAERRRYAEAKRATTTANTALPAIEALAEGRDGRLYFLVSKPSHGSSLALDRYDQARGKLERVQLLLSTAETVTMAAGRDGLYLAAFDGRKGRWKLAWERLEEAAWRDVEGVKIDGMDVVADGETEPSELAAAEP